MSLYASAFTGNNEGNFERPEADKWLDAVCVAIAAVGPVYSERFGNYSNKVWLKFEFDKDGNPENNLENWFSFTQSIGTKSNLGKVIRDWRGRDFTPEELSKFSLVNVLGVGAHIKLSERTSSNGKVYSDIKFIEKPEKKVTPSEKPWTFDIEDPARTNWDKLPKFIQSQIEAGQQRQGKSVSAQSQANVKTEVVDPIDLDIPF